MKCSETLRDCQAWRDEKLPLSTCSNEAAKLLDAGFHQYVGWFEDERYDGLAGTCEKMLQADENFIMGKVFAYGLALIGTGMTSRLNDTFAKQLSDLRNTCQTHETVTDREKMHVNAINVFAEGNFSEAAEIWEEILLEYPTDMLALKFAHDTYFYLGDSNNVRDSIARVLPCWKPTLPYYGYLKGMLSFGQEETNFFREAETSANEALYLNKNDGWAVHTLAHIHEMYDPNEGMKCLKKLESDWKPCGLLACHLNWHWGLYAVEKGDYELALRLYDEEIKTTCVKSGGMLDIMDSTSLLYRLQLEGVDVEDRWQDIVEICRPHLDDHILSFNDAHFLMSFLGAKNSDLVEKQMQSTANYLNVEKLCQSREITKNVGLKIMNAFVDYDNGEYDKVVNNMYPIRQKIYQIGGSHAQRDLFNQLLIHSCLKSKSRKNSLLARSLLYERKALKPNSPLTGRLLARLLSCHVD